MTLSPQPRLLALVALAAALGACSTRDTGKYPSLALRDVERITGSAEPVEPEILPETPVAPGKELSARIDQLSGQARLSHQRFLAALPATRSAVSGSTGAAVASEAWARAEAALGALRAARNPTLVALADLDALYVASEMEVGAADALFAARNSVAALVSQQDQAITLLEESIPIEEGTGQKEGAGLPESSPAQAGEISGG